MDKELMDCTLSPYEIRQARFQAVISEGCPINATEFSIGELISEVTKAVLQSSKLKAYITEQVQAERERHIERLNDMMGIGNICNERVFDYIKELEEVTK